jgi:hypothetical protein
MRLAILVCAAVVVLGAASARAQQPASSAARKPVASAQQKPVAKPKPVAAKPAANGGAQYGSAERRALLAGKGTASTAKKSAPVFR